VPYVKPVAKAVEVWGTRMGERDDLRIGMAWAAPRGGDARSRRKSCPLSALNRLGQIAANQSSAGVTFFSLQRNVSASDLSGAAPALKLVDLTSKLADFSDSAALIANLDLVITVDTAVAHLAGAMGKPVWVLLPFAADFRWLLDRPDTPWYPTMRLIRQRTAGDWDGVVDQVIGQLRSFITALNP
jgi:ADP-heptose:LPS heptosyltransferase